MLKAKWIGSFSMNELVEGRVGTSILPLNKCSKTNYQVVWHGIALWIDNSIVIVGIASPTLLFVKYVRTL